MRRIDRLLRSNPATARNSLLVRHRDAGRGRRQRGRCLPINVDFARRGQPLREKGGLIEPNDKDVVTALSCRCDLDRPLLSQRCRDLALGQFQLEPQGDRT